MDDDRPRRVPVAGAESHEARAVALHFADDDTFRRALIALNREELVIRSEAIHGVAATIALLHGGGGPGGIIWVLRSKMGRAEVALGEAGVPFSPTAAPIVDRSDPVCPSCGAALDPEEPETCLACGRPFTWIDVNEPPVDPTGVRCGACGYDLTGNESGRCPECNALVPTDLDRLVDLAEQDDSTQVAPDQGALSALASTFVGGLVLVLFIAAAVALMSDVRQGSAILLLLILLGLVILGIRRMMQSRQHVGPESDERADAADESRPHRTTRID